MSGSTYMQIADFFNIVLIVCFVGLGCASVYYLLQFNINADYHGKYFVWVMLASVVLRWFFKFMAERND